MEKLGNLTLIHARSGKEKELEHHLKAVLPLAEREPGTTAFYAFRLSPTRFGIFEAFRDKEGRDAHRCGKVVDVHFAKAQELCDPIPRGVDVEILAAKATVAGRYLARHKSPGASSATHEPDRVHLRRSS